MTITEVHGTKVYSQHEINNCDREKIIRCIIAQQKEKYNNCCIIDVHRYGINIPDRDIKIIVTHSGGYYETLLCRIKKVEA